MSKFRRFLSGVLILSATSFLMRAIGVRFNLYLTDKLGAEGLGLFTLTMSVYSLAVTFATSAVGLAATRLISEAIGGSRQKEIRPAMGRAILYSLTFGCATGAVLFLFASPIGRGLLGDGRTVKSLRLLALSLPFVALSSALTGYFTAVRRVGRSSAIQILGQLARIGITAAALEMILPDNLEIACLSVIAGGVIAEGLSFVLSLLLYLRDHRRYPRGKGVDRGPITKSLISIAIPVALSSYLRSALTTIEHLLIPWGLRRHGNSSDRALEVYGVMQGMALPVILFPYAFLTPFTSLIVPEIAELRAADNYPGVTNITKKVFRFACIFGLGTAGIVLCYSGDLGTVVCHSAEAGKYIRLIAPLIPIMYLDTCVDSILKGMNEQLYSMQVNIVDSLLSVVIVFLLLPRIGIYGFIVELYVCEIINASLSIARLLKVVPIDVGTLREVFLPLICVIGATALARLILSGMGLSLIWNGGLLTLHILLSALIYLSLLLLTGSVKPHEIAAILGKRRKVKPI